jgi:hypothetical protein
LIDRRKLAGISTAAALFGFLPPGGALADPTISVPAAAKQVKSRTL